MKKTAGIICNNNTIALANTCDITISITLTPAGCDDNKQVGLMINYLPPVCNHIPYRNQICYRQGHSNIHCSSVKKRNRNYNHFSFTVATLVHSKYTES